MPVFGITYISVFDFRFYFSQPKAKGFDLSSYLVTNGDIWKVEYDAVYASDLFLTPRMVKRIAPDNFSYIKDFYIPFLIMPDMCCQLK